MFKYYIGFKLKNKKERKSFKNATSPVILRSFKERIGKRLKKKVLKSTDIVVPCKANPIGSSV